MNQAHDDDGIIDLRALASTPPRRGAFPMVSPFLSEPPPASFVRDADTDGASQAPASSSKAKTVAMIAGAALFVVLGGVGVAFAFRGEKPAVVARAPIAPPPAPVVVVAPPAPAADPAPAASPAVDEGAAASDAASTKKTKGAKGRAVGANAKTKSAAAPAKPAVTKSADPCNCHGDFQCNIRCAAKK
jgi:hypothetical protein